jgi:hypothetical protein
LAGTNGLTIWECHKEIALGRTVGTASSRQFVPKCVYVAAIGRENVEFTQFLVIENLTKAFVHVAGDSAEAGLQEIDDCFLDGLRPPLLQNGRFEHGKLPFEESCQKRLWPAVSGSTLQLCFAIAEVEL